MSRSTSHITQGLSAHVDRVRQAHQAPRTAALARALSLALVVGVLVAAGAGQPATGDRADANASVLSTMAASTISTQQSEAVARKTRPVKRDGGLRVRKTGRAPGGWMGSYKVGKASAYRFDAKRPGRMGKYRVQSTPVADLNGSHRPSARATQRLAYVLAVYGDRGSAAQRAAVDAVTYHLVAGKKWRITKAAGRKRIAQTGRSRSTVSSYAEQMLKASANLAGPYRVSAQASSTTSGASSRVTVEVRSSVTNGPLAARAVTISYQGQSQTVYTNANGAASAVVNGAPAGASTVNVSVADVPADQLVVAVPKKPGKSKGHKGGKGGKGKGDHKKISARKAKKQPSRMVLAGRTSTLSTTATVMASATQQVSVSNASTLLGVGQQLTGSYSIQGGTGTRSVTFQTHGPADTSAATCNGPVAQNVESSTSSSEEAGPLPAYTVGRSGYYRSSVSVGGNDQTPAASACGPVVRVRSQGGVSQARPSGQTKKVAVGEKFHIEVTTAGFDRGEAHTVTSRLYGPWGQEENARCSPERDNPGKSQTRAVGSNVTVNMDDTTIGSGANAGFYIWATTLSDGELIAGATSSCGVVFEVVQ